jgi:hypothetical protein
MLLLFAFVALLGAVAVVPQALAAPAEVKLEVNQNCVDPDWPCWATPNSSQPALKVTITEGGEVEFVDHDPSRTASVVWTGGPTTPSCPGVPTTTTVSTGWEGTCSFATPGTYHFESATLFKESGVYGKNDYTKYEVVVGGTPKAKTTPTSTERQTEATLTGTIEPDGSPVEYEFEWGVSPDVSEHKSATPTSLGAADFAPHSVSAPVTDLLPNTTYEFELIAVYGAGKTAVPGGVQTFTTPPAAKPAASTLAASALKETEATLNGKVDPEGGAEAEYFFEWGAGSSGSYEHVTQAVSLPSDSAEHQASATVTGLMPGGEYHFRLVAKNTLGLVQGNDLTFMAASTPPAKEPTKEPPAKELTKEPPAKEPSPTPTPTGGNPTATTSSPPPSGQPKTEPAPAPLFGSAKLASAHHGGVVHGSLVVSSAGSEGQLQIELLTKGAAAAVGKLVRSSLHAGKLTFALPLNAKGKAALRRRRRLTLTVKITLTPVHGAAVTVTRGILVRA